MVFYSPFFDRVLHPVYSNYYTQTYYIFLFFFGIAAALCCVLASLAYLLSLSSSQDSEKKSEYECGFEPFDSATRLPFDVHFYLVGILFLIFDVEIALLFPWIMSLRSVGWFGFYSMFSFILVLGIGFIYEWRRGGLIWPTKQYEQIYRSSSLLFFTPNIDLNFFSETIKYSNAVKESFNQPVLGFVEKLTTLKINSFSSIDYLRGFKTASTNLQTLFTEINTSGVMYKKNYNFNYKNFLLHFESSAIDAVSTIKKYTICDFTTEIFITIGILVFTSVVAYFIGHKDKSQSRISFLTLNYMRILLCIAAIFYVYDYSNAIDLGACFSNDYVIQTKKIIAIKLLIILSSIFVVSGTVFSAQKNKNISVELPIAFLTAILFLLLLVSANNLIFAYFSIIGFSLNLYILIFSDMVSSSAREAGIKYFYLSSLSAGLMLYGLFIIYAATGSLSYLDMASSFSHSHFVEAHHNFVNFGLTFFIFGIFFKLSAAPCHMWAPEVYDGAPNSITAFFILPVKIGVLSFLIFFLQINELIHELCLGKLEFAAAASLIFGSLGAVSARRTKKFLAYASVSQMGFLLTGLVAGPIYSGYDLSLFYLLLYVFANIIFIQVFLWTRTSSFKPMLYLSHFQFALLDKTTIFCFCVALFSLAGIPPIAGFFGKYFLLIALYKAGFPGLVFLALFVSLISTWYYLRLIKLILFISGKKNNTSWVPSPTTHFTQTSSLLRNFITTLLLSFILFLQFI